MEVKRFSTSFTHTWKDRRENSSYRSEPVCVCVVRVSVTTYNAVIRASEKGKRLDTTFELCEDMRRKGLEPGKRDSSYMRLDTTFELFEDMQRKGLEPDLITTIGKNVCVCLCVCVCECECVGVCVCDDLQCSDQCIREGQAA